MTATYDSLREVLGSELLINTPLSRYSTMRIGGPADYFFEAKTGDEIVKCINYAKQLNIPVTILGGGTNTLIGDLGIRGMVIKNNTRNIALKGVKGTIHSGSADGVVYVEVDSGVIMNALVRFTIEEGLGGLEMHLGLPGTVGGAIYMNSKWTHPEGYVGDCLYQATILTPKGELRVVPRPYFSFGYDTSSIQSSGDTVLRAVFSLKPVTTEKLWKIANESMTYRRSTQPQGVASLGCTFQNISKNQAIKLQTPNLTTSAGYLVDQAGLKGKRIGDAQISPVHANFILNLGHATSCEVVELIELSHQKVKEKFSVNLKEEIVRIGEF